MTLYLDTSSLVKLYVDESGANVVRQLVDDAAIVATSVIAYAETRAAFARLRRERAWRPAEFASAKREFEQDWPSYLTLDVTESVSRVAGDLAERYGLRGYDSVHLATFVEITRQAGAGVTRFSSFDDRLNRAARAVVRTLARSAATE